MCSIPTLYTIRVQGLINGKAITVLVDSGSTHSFINTELSKKLHLNIQDSLEYSVQIANGDKIQGRGLCKGVVFKCQGCTMPIDLLKIHLEGCQVVLVYSG